MTLRDNNLIKEKSISKIIITKKKTPKIATTNTTILTKAIF